jgi:tetratricopeptide (TPR) repeat protein
MEVTVSFLDDLEKRIRDNTAPGLAHLIDTIKPSDIPRPLLARYANLIRRIGGIKYALKILNPVVRNTASPPKVVEVIEYASCLTRLFLSDEAIELLKEIQHDPHPEIQYELAAAHVSKWDYAGAIPYFKKYLTLPGLTPYKKCVGEINLGASYIYVHKLKEAKAVLEKLIEHATKDGFKLLVGNGLELLGEIALIERNFKVSKKFLLDAKEVLNESIARYDLYVDKWLVIAELLKEKGSEKTLRDANALRKKITELKEWNTLREIELFKAIATDDANGVANVYYGVPYPEFRKRILSLWGKPLKVNPYFERKIGPGKLEVKRVFDVTRGLDLPTGAQLKPGQAMHRMVQCLATDWYSPFSTTMLFSIVFKGSRYNPVTSPQQIYEIVKRTNEWFADHKIPLEVVRGQGGYRLRAKEAYVIKMQTNFSPHSKLDEFLELLKSNGLLTNFSVKMAEEKSGLPRRTVTRLLGDAVKEGKLTRQGKTQSTTYSFVNVAAAA